MRLTADTLRQGILGGEWTDRLPAERELSKILQVSRPTLGEAIRVLRDEGLLISRDRKPHHILPQDKTPCERNSRTAVFLFGEENRSVRTSEILFYIDEIRRELQKVKIDLTILSAKGLDTPHPEKKLREIATKNPARAWILCSVSHQVQEWFTQSLLPSLLIGTSAHKNILPSLDLDYQAIGRHAAGTFLSSGHRRIACFLSEPTRPGDLATQKGFEAAVHPYIKERDSLFKTVLHKADTASVCLQIDRMLKDKVTAILVGEFYFFLTVASHLLRKGIRLPEEVSLIARDNDSSLDFFVPAPARYQYDLQSFARKLTRLVVQLSTQSRLPTRSHLVIPDFSPGETIHKLPAPT